MSSPSPSTLPQTEFSYDREMDCFLVIDHIIVDLNADKDNMLANEFYDKVEDIEEAIRECQDKLKNRLYYHEATSKGPNPSRNLIEIAQICVVIKKYDGLKKKLASIY